MLRNILLIMLAFTLLCICCTPHRQKALPTPDISEIRSVGKLTLSEMAVSKSGTIEDLTMRDAGSIAAKAKAILNSLKIGTRKGVYAYNTYLRAYIDLNELKPEDFRIDSVLKAVYITLPPIRTEISGRDATMEELHYRVSGLRSNISETERANLKEAMNSELKSEVENNSGFEQRLISNAREKASLFFSSFYSDLGYETFVEFD